MTDLNVFTLLRALKFPNFFFLLERTTFKFNAGKVFSSEINDELV